MIRKDLVPLKVVLQDLCVSETTLWRARQSKLEGFPAPTIIRRQLFWRKDELSALETALMAFRGRTVFEQSRRVEKASQARRRLRGRPAKSSVFEAASDSLDLFDDV